MTVQIVLDVLLPILNEMKQDLNHLATAVRKWEEKVSSLDERVSNMEDTVEQHKSQTTSEIADLYTSIDNPPTNVILDTVVKRLLPYLNILENSLERIDESTESLTGDLSSVNAIVTDLKEKVCSVNDSQTETLDMIDLKLDSVSDILNQVNSEPAGPVMGHSTTYTESLDMMSVSSDLRKL